MDGTCLAAEFLFNARLLSVQLDCVHVLLGVGRLTETRSKTCETCIMLHAKCSVTRSYCAVHCPYCGDMDID